MFLFLSFFSLYEPVLLRLIIHHLNCFANCTITPNILFFIKQVSKPVFHVSEQTKVNNFMINVISNPISSQFRWSSFAKGQHIHVCFHNGVSLKTYVSKFGKYMFLHTNLFTCSSTPSFKVVMWFNRNGCYWLSNVIAKNVLFNVLSLAYYLLTRHYQIQWW